MWIVNSITGLPRNALIISIKSIRYHKIMGNLAKASLTYKTRDEINIVGMVRGRCK